LILAPKSGARLIAYPQLATRGIIHRHAVAAGDRWWIVDARESITTGGSDECGGPKAAVEDLIAKVVGGKALEAFDRYYADDVTMQENEQPPPSWKGSLSHFRGGLSF
jgi:hypothetical protein